MTAVDPSLIAQGYRAAQAVTREHAKSFYFASIALFGARRRGAFALYSFCRRLDDLVDIEQPSGLDVRLKQARALVAGIYWKWPDLACSTPGVLPETPDQRLVPWPSDELAALEDTIRCFRIPERPFQDLISGMEMDVRKRRYATFAELDLYCYRVAGTIGLMLTPLLGYSDPWALGPAAELGKAMQLTNILRDIKEDLDRDILYLPADELAAFGLSEDDLRDGRVDDRFIAFMRCQISRARSFYARAATGVPYLTGFGSQRMVRMMGSIYGGILEEIEAQGYDVFRARARVSTGRKLGIAARVLCTPTPTPRELPSPIAVPALRSAAGSQ